MKKAILFLCLLFAHTSLSAENEHLLFKLLMADYCATMQEYKKMHTILKSIGTECESSEDWIVRKKYYGYCSDYFYRKKKYEKAKEYSIREFKSYPSYTAPSQEYLWVALNLAILCDKTADYTLGEQVASEALFRSLSIADSCSFSSSLYYYLACFYEKKGDTIMPTHFHEKSQSISINHMLLTEHLDSLEIFKKRYDDMRYQLRCEKPYFTKEKHSYLLMLIEYAHIVNHSDNEHESILLYEEILQLAQNYDLLKAHHNELFECCISLLQSYIYEEQFKEASNLITKALNYWKEESSDHEIALYLAAGDALTETSRYKEALKYYKRGLSKAQKNGNYNIQNIKNSIEKCKKFL